MPSRNLAALTLLALALFASLCGAEETSKQLKVVAFAQDTMGNDWRVAQVKEVEEALKGVPGVRFVYSDANGESARQIRNIEDFIYAGVDVLITSPRNAELMAPVIAKARAADIPVVLLSRTVAGADYTTFIHPDNRAIAAKAARFIAERLNGEGKILMLRHIPTTTPGMRRTEGFMEALKDYPGVEVVAMKVANSLRGEAIVQTEAALREGLAFDAIYAQSDSMAIGAIIALRKNGIDPSRLVITGIDYISEARELIRSGDLAASYVYPTAGREGAMAALDILAGRAVEREVVLDSTEVTIDNVERVAPIF